MTDETKTYLATNKILVDNELDAILTDMMPPEMATEGYVEALKHSVLEGGKRLRPIIALATYELYRPIDEEIIRASCVTELIHAGSLMLDDLPCMDNAEYRRGKKSSHSLFGESLTILSSAALWVESYRILAGLKTEHHAQLVQKAADSMGGKGLIQGQLLDLAAFNATQNIEELRKCYELKTSVMFDLAVSIGAILGGASDSELDVLHNFAVKFGVAYQIRDDIIDETQTIEQAGKDTGLDSKNGKPNYVSLLGIKEATNELNQTIDEALSHLKTLNTDSTNLKGLSNALRSI